MSNHGIDAVDANIAAMDEIRHERRMSNASLVMFFLVVTFCVVVMFGMALTDGMDWRAEIIFFTIVGPLLIFALITAPEKASYFLKMTSNARDASNMIDVFLIARLCVIVIYLASYMLMMSLTTNEISYAWNLTVSASFILISVYLLAISHMKMRRALRTVQYTFTRVSTVVE
jgi:heme/copper-type cytochrome/quinol oxidase subunit 4